MIRHFIWIWIFYWAAAAFLPASSLYESVGEAFLLQLIFLILVLLGFSWSWLAEVPDRSPICGTRKPKSLQRAIQISLIFSSIGTLCIIYDKIAIQGIDYSQGVAVAREAWRKEGVERGGGISSIFSILGYLLSSGYYVAAVLLVAFGENLKKPFLYKGILLVFILLMVNSVLAGGRSNVLLVTVFVAGAITAVSGWSYRSLFPSKGLRSSVLLLALFSFSYVLYVFSERAEATGIDISAYVKHFLPYLGLKIDPWFSEISGSGVFFDVINLLVLALSYITHSLSTAAGIIENGPGDKVIVFLHPLNILSKLGVIGRPDSSWFLYGRFPSLPAALLYQFGHFGFFVISILIGFLSAIARCIYLSFPSSIVAISFYLMMYSVLIISPLLLAIDFMSFPFVMFSFFLVAMILKLNNLIKRSL
ncbi:hypothetical protein [Marinobacter salsuginis]|uniref:hypothetical protein n=1 Tax=Marinobacter salsuginis TaxID=418719 RepID=UPI001ADEF767|nr:hypothetical protein [Marinobacter salsuginis]QTN40173.1 hypothetical protein HZ997_10430 [Marinobacter salsuginis]